MKTRNFIGNFTVFPASALLHIDNFINPNNYAAWKWAIIYLH